MTEGERQEMTKSESNRDDDVEGEGKCASKLLCWENDIHFHGQCKGCQVRQRTPFAKLFILSQC